MELGKTLIDAACKKTGMTRYAISKTLHVSDGFVSRVYNGRDPVPPALAARLAVMAGVDARRAAMEALVSQEKDHAKAVELAEALGIPAPAEPPTRNGVTVQLACSLRTTARRISKLIRRVPVAQFI